MATPTVDAGAPIRHEHERNILALYARGASIDAIVAAGHDRKQVEALVMHRVTFDRRRARHLVRQFDLSQETTVETAVDGIKQLLNEAKESGITKAIRLADRISADLASLETAMKDSAKERELLARKQELRKELDAADAALRSLRGRGTAEKGKADKPTQDRVSPRVVREWAREQGIECTDMGRVPKQVQALYDAARGSS